ncbi:MAG TPA: DUF4123 domain-containing protein [Candidatus Angelobacter sp.]|nr:DUF4123 domain-containing protein [Candidatus Angelobacter sp.]
MLSQRIISEQQLKQLTAAGYAFAILDPCMVSETIKKAEEAGQERAVSLFNQTPLEEYFTLAPYVFRADEALLEWIPKQNSVLVFAKVSLQELAAHLQFFLMAALPDRRRWYFRFYDPRILKAYLPSCDLSELSRFYGPIRAFGFHQEENIHVFEREATGETVSVHDGQLWTIRPEQYNLFAQLATVDFLDRMARHLAQKFSSAVKELGPERTRQWVHSGIDRARAYNLTSEQQIGVYLDLIFTFGFDFDQRQPWAVLILNDPELNAETKALRLQGFIVE